MTRIRSLVADHVRIPFRRPFRTANGLWSEHDAWIIRVVDADGRAGVGEATLGPGIGVSAERALASLVFEAAGAVPSRAQLEAHGVAGRALSAAIESAVIDLEARSVPPRLAAGGEGVGVNATIPSLDGAAAAEAAAAAVASGFATLKLKAGDEPETSVLVERIRSIRAAVGSAVRLRVDANGTWDSAAAEERLDAIAEFDIEYVEQPLSPDDIAGLARLRRRVRIPIAADEGASSVAAVRALLAADGVDVLVVKLARVGGPAAAGEIAAAAAEHGVRVVVSTLFETGVGIAAALDFAARLPEIDHGLATAGLLEHDLLAEPLAVTRGRMRAPGSSGSGGLGIVLDAGALRRFSVESIGVPA